MDEESPTQKQGPEPTHGDPELGVPKLLDPPPHEPATKEQLKEIKDEMSAFERSTVAIAKSGLRWTRATAAVFAVTLIVAFLQWRTMDKQLSEMRSGGTDTGNLVNATKTQADRMKDFVDRMKDQGDRTKDLADGMKEQAGQTKIIAETNREALTSVQRAFVVFRSFSATPVHRQSTNLDTWEVAPIIDNSGNTPTRKPNNA